MPRFALLTLCAVVLIYSAAPALTAAEEDRVWVAMTVRDGRGDGGVEYYGMVKRETLDQVLDGTREKGFLKLEKVFWLNDKGEPERLVKQPYGYTSVAHFRIANIDRIVPLKEKFLEDLQRNADEVQGAKTEEAKKDPCEAPAAKEKE